MYISTKGRYALRLMTELAYYKKAEQIVPLKKISENQNISLKYLEQIITVLIRAGFVKSIRGSQGGYLLADEPENITVGMVLRATEGTLSPVPCIEDKVNQCPRSEICSTLFIWKRIDKAIADIVDSITLVDILNENEKNNGANDYVI